MDPKVYEEWIPNLGIQLIKYRCIPSFYSPAIGSIGSPVDPLWIPRKLEFYGGKYIKYEQFGSKLLHKCVRRR